MIMPEVEHVVAGLVLGGGGGDLMSVQRFYNGGINDFFLQVQGELDVRDGALLELQWMARDR